MKVVRWIVIGIVAMTAIWAVSLPFMLAALDHGFDHGVAAPPTSPPALPISLAIGGEGCTLPTVPVRFLRFTTADRIRLISGQAPGDADVVITLFPLPHDTAHPAPSGYPAHRHFESGAACVSEFLPPLGVGLYEAWVQVGESGASVDFPVVEPSGTPRP